jgi:hypothetical protein
VSKRITRATRKRRNDRRWISAPPDSDPSVANRVLGVWLAAGERVRWEWTALVDGRQFVCGYTIEEPWRAADRGTRPCGFRVGE